MSARAMAWPGHLDRVTRGDDLAIDAYTVLYDAQCAFCRRCRDWLAAQPVFVPVVLVAAQSEEARKTFGALPWLGAELVVVGPDGEAWIGGAAFLVCLWLTVRYRAWAYRLAGPAVSGLAVSLFEFVSRNRTALRLIGCRDATCTSRRLSGRAG